MKCPRCHGWTFECEACAVHITTKAICVMDDEAGPLHFCSWPCWRKHFAKRKEAMS